MKSTLFIATLFAATTASAQSSLLLPNNSAGTEMDTPPVLHADPRTLDPKALDPVAPRSDAPRSIEDRNPRDRAMPDASGPIRDARPEPDEPEALREPPRPSK